MNWKEQLCYNRLENAAWEQQKDDPTTQCHVEEFGESIVRYWSDGFHQKIDLNIAKGTADPGVDCFDLFFWFGRAGSVCLVG